MNETLKIKLSIGDRVYPMTVSENEEEGLRKAAKKIDQLIKHYEQNYAVRDKQDVLAMCALQFASQTEQESIDKDKDTTDAEERLQKMSRQIADILSPRS